MAKVLCTRPNASDEISGIKFEQHERGMVSVDIDDEQAAAFLDVGGYESVGADDGKAAQAQADADTEKARAAQAAADAQAKEQADAQRKADADQAKALADAAGKAKAEAALLEAQQHAALVEKAKALGVDVKGNWKEARLKAEIQRAEDAAAAAAGNQTT